MELIKRFPLALALLLPMRGAVATETATTGTASAAVDTALPRVTTAKGPQLLRHLSSLGDELDDIAKDKKSLPDARSRALLTNQLIQAMDGVGANDPLRPLIQGEVARLLLEYGDGKRAKGKLVELMRTGGTRVIDAPLRIWGSPHSIISKDDRWQIAQDLYDEKLIDLPRLVYAQRETDPQRAKPLIIKLARETRDRELFIHVARNAQQYHDPELFALLMSRVEELDLLKPVGALDTGLTWVDEADYIHYLKHAKDSDLLMALKPLRKAWGVLRESVPVLIERKLLDHPYRDVRLETSRLMFEATQGSSANLEVIEKAVELRLRVEKDGEIISVLKSVLDAASQERERREKWRNK